jgi:hypothetical protein
MGSEPAFDDVARFDPEHHATVQMWFARNKIPDDVGAHRLFVNGVSLDVFTVEAHARLGCAHPLQRLDESP